MNILYGDKMNNEKIEIKKEIHGISEHGIKYSVKNLNTEKHSALLFGTLTINGKSRDFEIRLDDIDGAEDCDDDENDDSFNFEDDDVEDDFDEALLDFYLNHMKTKIINENKKTKDEEIIVEKRIIIEFK
jgi:hypothetical protein